MKSSLSGKQTLRSTKFFSVHCRTLRKMVGANAESGAGRQAKLNILAPTTIYPNKPLSPIPAQKANPPESYSRGSAAASKVPFFRIRIPCAALCPGATNVTLWPRLAMKAVVWLLYPTVPWPGHSKLTVFGSSWSCRRGCASA